MLRTVPHVVRFNCNPFQWTMYKFCPLEKTFLHIVASSPLAFINRDGSIQIGPCFSPVRVQWRAVIVWDESIAQHALGMGRKLTTYQVLHTTQNFGSIVLGVYFVLLFYETYLDRIVHDVQCFLFKHIWKKKSYKVQKAFCNSKWFQNRWKVKFHFPLCVTRLYTLYIPWLLCETLPIHIYVN